ncbi:hypothetical protein [Pseudomonas matsuisoli]|nr:hypothetical protein [Pseudomonas matsuisoli]
MKWTLALPAILLGLVIAGEIGVGSASTLGLWNLPVAGFSAAFAVVVVAYLASPSHKRTATVVAFTCGAIAAWMLLEPAFLPENYGAGRAYQPTHLPIIFTYAGGLLGCLVALLIRRWTASNGAVKPTPPPRMGL